MTPAGYRWVAFGVASIALAGVAVTRLSESTEREHGVYVPSPTAAASAGRETPVSGNDAAAIAAFKAKIRLLHPGLELSDREIEAAQEEEVDLMQLPLPERKHRMDQAFAAHRREGWDSKWATATEETLSDEFRRLGEESVFEVAKIECRTSSCLLTVTWNGHELAALAYEALTSTPVGFGCRPQMLPPEVGAREAVLHLDCTRARRVSDEAVPMVASIHRSCSDTTGRAMKRSNAAP